MRIWTREQCAPLEAAGLFKFVDPEAPIDVSAADNSLSEPEPDLIVLNRA